MSHCLLLGCCLLVASAAVYGAHWVSRLCSDGVIGAVLLPLVSHLFMFCVSSLTGALAFDARVSDMLHILSESGFEKRREVLRVTLQAHTVPR